MTSFKVLSFDVGIKNLAYCILDYNIVNKDYKITDWGIINLSDEEKFNTCSHVLVDKKTNVDRVCGKKASYICNDKKSKDTETRHFCKVHRNRFIKDFPDSVKCIAEIKKKKKVKKPLLELNITMVEKMNEIPELLEVDEVLIENQPSLKNPHMKSIQMMIFSYFVMKGFIENKLLNNIVMLSARNKLKIYNGEPIDASHIKDKYRQNKYLAIKYCGIMIQTQSEEYKTQYDTSKKKDDLADSFLQGVFYLNRQYKFIK
jgi:hypothetical protein